MAINYNIEYPKLQKRIQKLQRIKSEIEAENKQLRLDSEGWEAHHEVDIEVIKDKYESKVVDIYHIGFAYASDERELLCKALRDIRGDLDGDGEHDDDECEERGDCIICYINEILTKTRR